MVGLIALEWGPNGELENESKHEDSKRRRVVMFYTHGVPHKKITSRLEKWVKKKNS